jgi:hypothetical protein
VRYSKSRKQSVSFSSAKTVFVNDLLSDLGYKISLKPEISGPIQEHEFDWKPSEEKRTRAAGERLASLMSCASMTVPLEFVPVLGCKLRDVHKGKQRACGQTDLRVARRGWTPPTDNVFSEARGLVELKVGTDKFTEAQLHLELVSVSLASLFKQGVALLATDCLTRWGVWSFDRNNNISGVWYLDSRAAIEDFKKKMETALATPSDCRTS